jgi:hypothetical protein
MATKHKKPSALASFKISFEYDVTWQEAKQAVKERTYSLK